MEIRIKNLLFSLLVLIQVGSCLADPIVYVLRDPGVYSFASGWPLMPTDPNDAWVSIQTSNVVLDMGYGSVVQDPSASGVENFTGIIIGPNLTNITIKNGLIKNLTGQGIYVDQGCSSITFENMNIQNCDGSGIKLDGVEGNIINGVTITNSSVSTCTGFNNGPAYGIIANYVSNVTSSLSNFTYNYSFSAPSYGAFFSNCKSCHFLTTLFGNNTGTPLGVGVYLQNCEDFQILNSVGSLNSALDGLSTSSGIGFVFDGTTNSNVVESAAVKNGGTGINGIGFLAMNGSNNFYKGCAAQGNIGDNTGIGYALVNAEDGTHVFDSYALQNNGASASYGVLLDGATNCSVLDNKLNKHTTGSVAVGYLDTSTSNGNKIKHNLYYNNATQADVD